MDPKDRVIIITDAGFLNAWFRHIKLLGWDFIGRIRGNIQIRLNSKGEYGFKCQELPASNKPEYLGSGTLARAEYARCDGHFYLHKKESKDRKHKHSRCRIRRKSQVKAFILSEKRKHRRYDRSVLYIPPKYPFSVKSREA